MAASGMPEAERLVQALAEGSQVAEELLRRASLLESKFKTMKLYEEKARGLEGVPSVSDAEGGAQEAGGARETQLQAQWCRDLLDENQEYRDLLEEMQSALDLIMCKHRAQVKALLELQQKSHEDGLALLEREKSKTAILERELTIQTGKLARSADIMCMAAEADADPRRLLVDAELTRLRTENQGLRELLEIAGISLPEDESV